MAGENRLHRRVQGRRQGSPPGPQAQRRRRRPGRSEGTRRRAAGGVRLPDRLVPVLGARARTGRLRVRPVRRELHRGGTCRRRGVRRGPLPDRDRVLRGHPAASDLLPGRDTHERPADSRPARLPPPPGLLLPGARRGRGTGGRRDHQALHGTRADAGRRSGRAVVSPRSRAPGAAPGAADPRSQPGLAGLVPGSAGSRTRKRQRRPRRSQPSARMAGVPDARCHGDHTRERVGDLDPPRGPRGGSTAGRPPGPVPHAPSRSRRGKAFAVAQLLPLRTPRGGLLPGQREA